MNTKKSLRSIRSLLSPLFLVLFMCLLAPKESIAQPVGCQTEAQVLATVDRFGAVLQRLDRISTATAIMFYDNIPPVGPSGADIAALVHAQNGSGIILVGNGNMYCSNVVIPAEHWQMVVRTILGINS